MNKKQREKYIRELAADPNASLDDILGVIGWDIDCKPEARKKADEELAGIIRKHWEGKERGLKHSLDPKAPKAKVF
jgi:hypothetical protein